MTFSKKYKQELPAGTAAYFADAFANYETPLLHYVTQLTGKGGDEVEDIVQDTFLRLYGQLSKSGPESIRNVSAWLYRTAHNLAMDAGRRRSRRKRYENKVMNDPTLQLTGSLANDHPDTRAARDELCEWAVRELQALDAEQKNILLLKIIEGFTLREISAITGLKIGTVNYRLVQGLRKLSERLKELESSQ